LEEQLIITAEGGLVGETTAEVGGGRDRVGKGNVGFRQTQVVLKHVRMRLHQALEQLNADLGVAMLQQHDRGHDIKGAEQARGRPVAEIRVDLAAAPGTAFDLRDQVRSGIFVVLPHDIVRILAIGGRVLTGGDQGFERVRYRQRVLEIGRRREFGMDGPPTAGARRAQAEKRGKQQRRPATEATARGHVAATYSP
jgi:hypothetical protein